MFRLIKFVSSNHVFFNLAIITQVLIRYGFIHLVLIFSLSFTFAVRHLTFDISRNLEAGSPLSRLETNTLIPVFPSWGSVTALKSNFTCARRNVNNTKLLVYFSIMSKFRV